MTLGEISMEVSEYLVGSPAFKAGGTSDPRPAGSIPVHLRNTRWSRRLGGHVLQCRYLGDGVLTLRELQSGVYVHVLG